MKRLGIFGIVIVLFCSIFGAGCATDQQVINYAEEAHGSLKPAVMNDQQLDNYLQSVGGRIIAVAREMDRQKYGPESHFKEKSDWMYSKEMQFHLVNSKTLNAFTTGGEHMYIYNQLFQEARSEDELAAVMAHEYGHVYARHVHKGMNRQMALMGVAVGAGLGGAVAGGKEHGEEYASYAAGAAMLGGSIFNMGFTRDDEAQADKLGFDFYCRAGWDPKHFGDFFQHMIDKGLDTSNEMLSDHPKLSKRVEASRKWANELPGTASSWRTNPVAGPRDFRDLQARAAMLGKRMPTDEQLAAKSSKILDALPRSCLTPAVFPDQKQAQADLAAEAKRLKDEADKAEQAKGKKKHGNG